jgi:membrane protein
MSYYALLSVFPAAIVAAAAAGWILDDPGAREDAVSYLTEELPLSSDQGRSDIESLLDGVTSNAGALGLVGFIALMFTASGLVSAARNSVDTIFDDNIRRGALRGKGLDLLLVLVLGVLFAASFATTLLGRLDVVLGGSIGDAIDTVLNATGALVPLVLAAIVFTVLYLVFPTERLAWRDIWPGVVFAALGYEGLKTGFSLYLDHFADYSAVYGSLGAVIAFMVFVWLASMVFLLGAAMASVWPAVKRGDYDPDSDEPDEPFREKVRSFLVGLVSRNRVDSD